MQTKQTHDNEQWLTSGEAAAVVGVSRDTIKRWQRAGRIAARRTPTGHLRFRRADVEALLQPTHDEGAAS